MLSTECMVCLFQFDADQKKPLILPCAHVYACKKCLIEYETRKMKIICCSCLRVFCGNVNSLQTCRATLDAVRIEINRFIKQDEEEKKRSIDLIIETISVIIISTTGGDPISINNATESTTIYNLKQIYSERKGLPIGTFPLLAFGKVLNDTDTIGGIIPKGHTRRPIQFNTFVREIGGNIEIKIF